MDELWRLIQDEAEAIAGYYEFLESDFVKEGPGEAARGVIQMVISDERDHLEALKYVYTALTDNKKVTDALDLAKTEMFEFKNRKK
jgi:rubrerythrin